MVARQRLPGMLSPATHTHTHTHTHEHHKEHLLVYKMQCTGIHITSVEVVGKGSVALVYSFLRQEVTHSDHALCKRLKLINVHVHFRGGTPHHMIPFVYIQYSNTVLR